MDFFYFSSLGWKVRQEALYKTTLVVLWKHAIISHLKLAKKLLLTGGSQPESPKPYLTVVLEIFDPFHLIDSLVQPSNEIIHLSNGELNFQELENFTTHYNDDSESSGDEWKIDETDIVHLFEIYLNYLKIRNILWNLIAGILYSGHLFTTDTFFR